MNPEEEMTPLARKYKRQSQLIARFVDDAFSEDSYKRAYPETRCRLCRLPYVDHPQLDNKLFLVCEGFFVRLRNKKS
jgi:hypothetical protein